MNTSSPGRVPRASSDAAVPLSLKAAQDTASSCGTWILAVGAGTRLHLAQHPVRWESQRLGEPCTAQFSPPDLVVTVDAGMTLGHLAQLLTDAREWLPLGLPHEQQDTVGGAVNAGLDGYWRGRYGPLRDRLLAVTIWTPAFGVTRLGAPVVKNVAGYNLPRLSWGTGGAFGIMLNATFKLEPLPTASVAWEVTYTIEDRAEAFRLGHQLRRLEADLHLLLLSQEDKRVTVTAGWQGRADPPRSVVEMLGTPESRDPACISFSHAESRRERWQGALPLAALDETWQAACGQTSELALDLLSGGVWAQDPAADFVAGIANRGGALRRQTSTGESGLQVGDPTLANTLARYKAAIDPAGLLRPLVGPDDRVLQTREVRQ